MSMTYKVLKMTFPVKLIRKLVQIIVLVHVYVLMHFGGCKFLPGALV